MKQTINRAGLELIKRHEGQRLTAYRDAVGIWTIGYGHTATAREGLRIAPETAEELLRRDLATAERAVTQLVKVELTDNQFSALVSFVFNVGRQALATSTLLRLLNAGDYLGAAEQFARWDKAGERRLEGLAQRRAAERRLFLEGATC
ncbi:lysozyme [Pseudomonas sp. RIT-PI-AD]|uniref:lysozyme n=1 Tax=Pseudomonas sp. RIT-PI-AD TaxID=3035294 RepID=UPI0021D9C8AF|nr:lysozyme [Pseudomonas sp. RIT-PI-AD]